ncbi:MAG: hypothetical protein ACLTWK_12040 [Eisenbergiella sp.]
MTLSYETIFSRVRGKIYDPKELSLNPDDLLEIYTERLNSVLGDPRIRMLFSSISLDDEIQTMTFELSHSVDEQSDKNFIIELFSIGMIIEWLEPQVNSILATGFYLGTKEEKNLINGNKQNIERLQTLKTQQHKMIRDYGSIHNSYVLGE